MTTAYDHSNDGKACCVANNNYHERCRYPLPVSDCHKFCDQDTNCKGYVLGSGFCEIATISPCNHASLGNKYDEGSVGNLVGSCGSGYGGCYVKQSGSKKLKCIYLKNLNIFSKLVDKLLTFLQIVRLTFFSRRLPCITWIQ